MFCFLLWNFTDVWTVTLSDTVIGVLEVFWFYATLIIFVENNNNRPTTPTLQSCPAQQNFPEKIDFLLRLGVHALTTFPYKLRQKILGLECTPWLRLWRGFPICRLQLVISPQWKVSSTSFQDLSLISLYAKCDNYIVSLYTSLVRSPTMHISTVLV